MGNGNPVGREMIPVGSPIFGREIVGIWMVGSRLPKLSPGGSPVGNASPDGSGNPDGS